MSYISMTENDLKRMSTEQLKRLYRNELDVLETLVFVLLNGDDYGFLDDLISDQEEWVEEIEAELIRRNEF